MERERAASSLRKWNLQDLRGNQPPQRASSFRKGGAEYGPPWPIYAGIFIIQFFVPGVLVSHGVYLSHLLQQEIYSNPFVVVWPPTVFLIVWCATRPVFKHLGCRHRGADSKVLAACGTLILAVGLAISSLTHCTIIRSLTFGLVGGLGCSLVLSQCETQLLLHFRPSASLCMSGVALSLGHFAAPLIMMSLVSSYGSVGAPLVQGAIALHGLIGALFFRKQSDSFKETSKPNLTGLEMQEDEEIVYMKVPGSESEEQKLKSRSWKNPASDTVDGLQPRNSYFEVDLDDDDDDVQIRPRNHMGVEIMPRIVEEDEEEDVILDLALRRLSRVRSQRESWSPAAPLNIYTPGQQDSTVDGCSPMPLLTPSSLDGRHRNVFHFSGSERLCSCTEFLTTRFKDVKSKVLWFISEVSHWSLIPSILLNSSQKLVQLGTAAVVPMVANEVVTFRRHEGAFSLAVMGFGWLCASVCTPCFLLPAAKRQKGLILSTLLLLSSIGFSLLSNPGSHDRLTLGCIVIGMTHGAIINITPAVHHALWGSASLKTPVESVIDVSTSCIIAIFVSLTFYVVESVEDFKKVFLCLSYLQITMGLGALAITVSRSVVRKYDLWILERRRSAAV